MATKPSSIIGYNPSRSNCVTVPSGKMAVGFLPGEKPPAQYLGDIIERIDRWLAYLDESVWQGPFYLFGDVEFQGNLNAGPGTGQMNAKGGSFTGPLVCRTPDTATKTPLVVFQSGTHARSLIDSLGYRQGQVTEFEELWQGTGTSNATGTANLPIGWNCITAPINGGGHVPSSATIEDPDVSFRQRRLRIDLPNTPAPVSEYTLWHNYLGWMSNDSAITFEQSILFQNVGNGTNLDIGFQFDNSGADNRFVVFQFLNDGSGGGTVKGKVVGASTTTVDLSASLPSNTPHNLKIEVVGSALSGLTPGTFQARFIFNGSSIGTLSFTNPGASKFRPYYKAYSLIVGAGDIGMYLGRLRVCSNHVQSTAV
jgi:hypothetical protein